MSQLLLVSSFIIKIHSLMRNEFSFNSIFLYFSPVINIDFYHKYYLCPLRTYKVLSLRCPQCLDWGMINFKQAEKYFKQGPHCEQSLRRQERERKLASRCWCNHHANFSCVYVGDHVKHYIFIPKILSRLETKHAY